MVIIAMFDCHRATGYRWVRYRYVYIYIIYIYVYIDNSRCQVHFLFPRPLVLPSSEPRNVFFCRRTSWHSDGLLGTQIFRIRTKPLPGCTEWSSRSSWDSQGGPGEFPEVPWQVWTFWRASRFAWNWEAARTSCFLFFWGFGDTTMKLHGGFWFVWICHILPLWMGKPTQFLREPTRMSRSSQRAELPLLHWINDVHSS